MTLLIFFALFLTLILAKRGYHKRQWRNVMADATDGVRTISLAYYLLEKVNYWLSRKLNKTVK